MDHDEEDQEKYEEIIIVDHEEETEETPYIIVDHDNEDKKEYREEEPTPYDKDEPKTSPLSTEEIRKVDKNLTYPTIKKSEPTSKKKK